MSEPVRRFNPHEEPDHAPAGPGRPREREYRQKIIDAALRLIDAEKPVTINALVIESGVSRAAIYRRWSSVTLLIAEALDIGRPAYEVDVSGDPKEVMKNILFDRSDQAREAYTQRRFRKRVEIVMIDRDVQMAYWRKHVSKRRQAEAKALQAGIDRGLLRADLNIEAALDALNGIFYYQVITRGVSNYEPDVIARCEDAFDLVWRGMEA